MSNLGYMIQVPFATTGNNPKLYRDPQLGPGALLMFKPSRQPETAFVNGTRIENIAASLAAEVMAVPEADLHASLFVSPYPTEFAAEKTTKGGLHLKTTAAAPAGAGRRIQIPLPVNITQRFLDRIAAGKKMFVALWGRPTRLQTTSRLMLGISNASSFTANYAFYMRFGSTAQPAAEATYNPGTAIVLDQPFNFSLTTDAVTGTGASASSWNTGLIIGLTGGAGVAGLPSMILYNLVIIDLELQGITYAQAKAINDQYYAEAFAPGGEFHGDSWSAPLA